MATLTWHWRKCKVHQSRPKGASSEWMGHKDWRKGSSGSRTASLMIPWILCRFRWGETRRGAPWWPRLCPPCVSTDQVLSFVWSHLCKCPVNLSCDFCPTCVSTDLILWLSFLWESDLVLGLLLHLCKYWFCPMTVLFVWILKVLWLFSTCTCTSTDFVLWFLFHFCKCWCSPITVHLAEVLTVSLGFVHFV